MPSVVKSYIGSTSGSVGIFAGTPEIPEGPPTWSDIPDQDTNFKDLPQTLDLKTYVRANPEITDWTTDVGTVDGNGLLTIPEGTPISVYVINLTAENALGTTPTTMNWVVSVEESPLPTLYINAQLAGGNEEPKEPPTNHNFAFNNGTIGIEINRDNEYYTWTTTADAARQVLQYSVNARHPDLIVGQSYIIGIEVFNEGPSSTRAISLSNMNNITLVAQDFTAPVGQAKFCSIIFRIEDVGWTCNFRFGTGTTTNRSETFHFTVPRLVHVESGNPVWETIPDQESDRSELPETLDVSEYVVSTLPIQAYTTDFGSITSAGILTIPEDTEVGVYTVTVSASNVLATSETSFTWTITDSSIVEPIITVHPEDYEAIEPSGHIFECDATQAQGANLFYRWFARRVGTTEWFDPEDVLSDVSGSRTRFLNVRSTDTTERQPPVIDSQPEDTTLIEPEGGSFKVEATQPDGNILYYRWFARRVGDTVWQDPSNILSDINVNSITTDELLLNSSIEGAVDE